VISEPAEDRSSAPIKRMLAPEQRGFYEHDKSANAVAPESH
jgi:hypothetical protein